MKNYFVQSCGCKIQVYSTGNLSSKISIVFLHGGPGSGAHAIMELSAFQRLECDYHCVYFDQRGSGKSLYDLKHGLSINDIVEDVHHIIADTKKRFPANKVILWGGSFGGYLACLYLERFDNELEGCILSSPVVMFNRQDALDFFDRTSQIYMKRLRLENTNHNLKPEEVFSSSFLQDFVWSDDNPSQSLRHVCAMSQWFYKNYFGNIFSQIKFPLLILQGQDDTICDYHIIDNEMKKNRNSKIEYYLYKNCGHELFKDREDEFVLKINEWLRRNERC